MIAPLNSLRITRSIAGMALALALVSGCKSKQDQAVDKAKQLANSTGRAQQVVSTDKNGNTITTTVQPLQQGQTTQAVTTIVTPATGVAPAATMSSAASPGTVQQPMSSTGASVQGAPAQISATNPAPGASSDPMIRPADVNVTAGTSLTIRINEHISVKNSRTGDHFTGEIAEPVVGQNNNVIIPRGTPVGGIIDESHRRGHFKGHSVLELRLTSMTLNGTQYALDTHDMTKTKKGKGKRSAALIGGGTGLGMLIGGVATGGVGLAIGGLAGAGAGTGIAGLTGNRDIEIPAESVVRFKLADDLVVQAS